MSTQENQRRKIPESVTPPKKYLVKPKNALNVSKIRHGFTGSDLGNSKNGKKSIELKSSGHKPPKKRSYSVAAKGKPFERGKAKNLEEGNVKKITTYFEKIEPNRLSKLPWGGEKVYERTAKLKDGAKFGNIAKTKGLDQIISHSTNYIHKVGRPIQTGTPASTGDYGVEQGIQTEEHKLSENKRKSEMWQPAEPKFL